MGLTSKFTYKNWDLSFALRASLNNYVYNDVLASKSSVGKGGIFNHGYYSNRPTAAVNLGFEGKETIICPIVSLRMLHSCVVIT